MGVFRRRWDYTPRRRKLPATPEAAAPDTSVVGVSNIQQNIFRAVPWQYYQPKSVTPTALFVPGTLNAISRVHPDRNPLLRDQTFRPPFLNYYQPKHVSPPTIFVPGITNAVQQVHPSRNPKLRDRTFRPTWKQYFQPKRVLPPSQFVPGITNVIQRVHPSVNPALRDRIPWKFYYQPWRVLPSSVFVPGLLVGRLSRKLRRQEDYWSKRRVVSTATEVVAPDALVVTVSRVHPSRNPRLRDRLKRFRQRLRRVLPAAKFVPGALVAKLRNTWTRKTGRYSARRVLPTAVSPNALVLVSKTHPSRSRLLRDWPLVPDQFYQPKRVLFSAIFIPAVLVALSRVHPDRNIHLRDETFRPPFRSYFRPKSLYLAGEIIVSISKSGGIIITPGDDEEILSPETAINIITTPARSATLSDEIES